ncbi:MAG: MBL fold metallo-hydrolase [Pseudomonadales bacterium]|nr:MBL fold metallo-hydrolase [Pseudomonadales bacterium]
MLVRLPTIFILLLSLTISTQPIAHTNEALDASRQSSIQHFYPNEPLPENDMRVTVLGSGTPFPRSGQAGPSILVEAGDEKILLDIGSGSPQNLASLEIPFRLLDKVFLTHLHVDHVGGLDSLWLGGWTYGRTAKLQVSGPPALALFVDISNRLMIGMCAAGEQRAYRPAAASCNAVITRQELSITTKT